MYVTGTADLNIVDALSVPVLRHNSVTASSEPGNLAVQICHSTNIEGSALAVVGKKRTLVHGELAAAEHADGIST